MYIFVIFQQAILYSKKAVIKNKTWTNKNNKIYKDKPVDIFQLESTLDHP